jgi:hypothetical protein
VAARVGTVIGHSRAVGPRLWTKGQPRCLTRRHLPISILVGEPLRPHRRDNPAEVTAELRNRISALLNRAQREYPDTPTGADDAWWQPAHLGGRAPTPEQVAAQDDQAASRA